MDGHFSFFGNKAAMPGDDFDIVRTPWPFTSHDRATSRLLIKKAIRRPARVTTAISAQPVRDRISQ